MTLCITSLKCSSHKYGSLNKRYSEFDELNNRLRRDLDPILVENLPKLPEKKFFFNMNTEFIEMRMRGLHEYLKLLILIYEALENPILQKFLEIDIRYDPYFEYMPIEFQRKEVKSITKNIVRKKSEEQINDLHPIKPKHEHNESSKHRGYRKNSNTRYRPHHGFNKESNRRSDLNDPQFTESGKNGRHKSNKRAPVESQPPKQEEQNTNNKKQLQNNVEIDFEPEALEKNKLTNIDIPKFRFFDTKVNAPIMENDPDHRSLNGEEDPFPLGPDKKKDIEDHTKELDSIKREIRSLRIKVDDRSNMSYSRIETKLNESKLMQADETMISDIKVLIRRAAV